MGSEPRGRTPGSTDFAIGQWSVSPATASLAHSHLRDQGLGDDEGRDSDGLGVLSQESASRWSIDAAEANT